MKVTDAFSKGSPTLSFEFFPPKTTEQEERLYKVIGELKEFNPAFASVTYGAMGTTREKTFFWAKELKNKFKIEPVAHLTCVAATKDSIQQQLEELKQIGVENILALRGDPPAGEKDFAPPADGFRHAKDLISFIKRTSPSFCVGAAGFPENEKNVEYLKEKVDAGAEYVITQLFFDNRYFFDFVEKCRKVGITIPIIAGIMPITSAQQTKKMTEVCCATIPPKLLAEIEKHESDKSAIQKIGIEQSVSQCKELFAAKVSGIHFFVMNQSGPISQILKHI